MVLWLLDSSESLLGILSHPLHLLFNSRSCHLLRSCWFKTKWGRWPEETPVLSIWCIATLSLKGEVQSTEFKDERNLRGHINQVFFKGMCLLQSITDSHPAWPWNFPISKMSYFFHFYTNRWVVRAQKAFNHKPKKENKKKNYS